MIKKITADLTLLPEGLLKNISVSYDVANGTIISISENSEGANYLGENSILTCGFVNSHCHLELSSFFKKIEEKTGLSKFINDLSSVRYSNKLKYDNEAILLADKRMAEGGIAVVGDICNNTSTVPIKKDSPIKYINFIEVFGLDSETDYIKPAKKIKASFPLEHSYITPHAPYSTNLNLLSEIANQKNSPVISIHNQESEQENLFFTHKKGSLFDLMKTFFNDLSIEKTSKSSLQYYLDYLPRYKNKILVHNTFTSKSDIEYSLENNSNIYWCFCPKANNFIEGRLPNFSYFKNISSNCVVGTDSLASNSSLDLISELKVIQDNSRFSFRELLNMITINGAKALKMEKENGCLKEGLAPGLNLLTINTIENLSFDKNTSVKKIC